MAKRDENKNALKTISYIISKVDKKRLSEGKIPFSKKTWAAISKILLSSKDDTECLLKLASIIEKELL